MELLEKQPAQLDASPIELHAKDQEALLAHVEHAAGIRGWYFYENPAEYREAAEYRLVFLYEDINLVRELTSDPARFATKTVPNLTKRQTPVGAPVETTLRFRHYPRDSAPLYGIIMTSMVLIITLGAAVTTKPLDFCDCKICSGRFWWKQIHPRTPYPDHLLTSEERQKAGIV